MVCRGLVISSTFFLLLQFYFAEKQSQMLKNTYNKYGHVVVIITIRNRLNFTKRSYYRSIFATDHTDFLH